MASMLNMAKHAIGMDNRKIFRKYGKECFIAYRNYYSVGPDGDSDWEGEFVKHGLATRYANKQGVIYHLTREGFEWLEHETGVIIYDDDHPEEDYALSDADTEEIKQVWDYIKENDIYAWDDPDEMDTEILLESGQLDDFFESYFCYGGEIPAMLCSYGVMVRFSDLIGAKVSGRQIWNLRPKTGMREEL